MTLPSYTVWFRGKPACPCLAEWLPVFEAELIRRGVIRESIDIAQLIGSAEASANTHSTGGAFDIWQHDEVTVWVARQMGADATWARTTGSFADNLHAHGVLRGCEHNAAARYQIDEVDAGGDGLVGSAPDPGPRPLSGRTWRQGIEWARQQEEDDMPTPEEIAAAVWNHDLNVIGSDDTARAGRMLAQIHNRGAKALTVANRISDGLAELEDQAQDDATKGQVHRLRRELNDLQSVLTAEDGDDTPHA